MRRLLLAPLIIILASPAQAGCGDYEGLMKICFKDQCIIDKLIGHCSAVVSGNHYRSAKGFEMGYFDYDKKGKARKMQVKLHNWDRRKYKGPHEMLLYRGDTKKSPWSFDTCGPSRFVGRPCEYEDWAK